MGGGVVDQAVEDHRVEQLQPIVGRQMRVGEGEEAGQRQAVAATAIALAADRRGRGGREAFAMEAHDRAVEARDAVGARDDEPPARPAVSPGRVIGDIEPAARGDGQAKRAVLGLAEPPGRLFDQPMGAGRAGLGRA